MKRGKKFFKGLIAGLAAATAVTAVPVGMSVMADSSAYEVQAAVQFSDVTNSKEWYYKPVYWAAEKGITTGTNGKFFPADNCTREQIATFLWRAMGKKAPNNTTSKFSDFTDSSRYSYKAVLWANENGVVTGTNGKFFPTSTCTREAAVTMIWRIAGRPQPKDMNSPFKDVTDKNSWSYKAILWAAENGITTGTDGKFFPQGLCKRREIVTFIYRYFQKFQNDGWKTENGKTYYYQNGAPVKGLQKIDGMWYEFDKSSGVYSGRSSDSLYMGSFFPSKNDQRTRYYVTLDGVTMTKLENVANEYKEVYSYVNNNSNILVTKSRDSNVWAKNGRFYTFITAVSNNSGAMYDFGVLETLDFQTYVWRTPNTSTGKTDGRWAPEYFEDDNGKLYVFYSVQHKTSDNQLHFKTYMTECLNYKTDATVHGSAKWTFTNPVQVTFNGTPSNLSTSNMIDANVIKKDGAYYMIIKREHDPNENLQSSLLIYKSTDLKNWNYFHNITVSTVFPANTDDTSYDFRAAEGPCITKIGDTYYLYADLYDNKNYNTTDPNIKNAENYEYNNEYMGIHIATSKDLKNWSYKGKLSTTTNDPLRHGSIRRINDEASEKLIQKLYNGGNVVEVPQSVTLNYTGSTQSFFTSIDSAWDKNATQWVFADTFFYAYSKEPKDRGTYEVTLKLRNKDKFKWTDGTTADKKVTCYIQ